MKRVDSGQTSLDEYVNVVASVYSPHDHHRSIWDVWCHTLHHAAGIAQQIRKGATEDKLHVEIADFSLWLFTVVLKLTGNFGQSEGRSETPQESLFRIQSSCSNLLWHKYPNACPLCSARKIAANTTPAAIGDLYPCECLGHQPEAEQPDARRNRLIALRKYSDHARSKKPTSIDSWQTMFGAIFGQNLALLPLTEVALHLMEELGEVSDAMIRMYTYKEKTFRSGEPNWRQSNLEVQLADVFSWLFALAEKLNLLERERYEHEKQSSDSASEPFDPVRLSKIIWRRYGSDALGSFYCPFCGETVCKCPILLVPATRTIEELREKYQ